MHVRISEQLIESFSNFNLRCYSWPDAEVDTGQLRGELPQRQTLEVCFNWSDARIARNSLRWSNSLYRSSD
jgi:hypothetical protein